MKINTSKIISIEDDKSMIDLVTSLSVSTVEMTICYNRHKKTFTCNSDSDLYKTLLNSDMNSFDFVRTEEWHLFLQIGKKLFNEDGKRISQYEISQAKEKQKKFEIIRSLEHKSRLDNIRETKKWLNQFEQQPKTIIENQTPYLDTKDIV